MLFVVSMCFSQISLTVTSTPASCFGASNGFATVSASGGTGPYSYTWTPTGSTSATLALVSSGVYTVNVEDAMAGTATATVFISQPTQLSTTSGTVISASCFGMCNGIANVMVTGGTSPYTYLWNSTPTQTTQTVNNLCAGVYSVQVTDANNCVSVTNVSISQPPQLNVFASSNNASCGGTCDGSIFTQASGGTPAYSYSWSPGGFFGPVANGLCPGMYTVNVVDANGCMATTTAVVNSTGTGSLSGVTPTLTAYNESCYLAGDGALDLELGGSNPGPFTYQWNTGATTQDLTNVSTNYYTVLIFDASMNCMSVSDTVMYDGTNCGTITGNLYLDMNSDCIKNSGDLSFSNAIVIANPGNRYAYPDAQGNYAFNSVPYGTYSVTTSNYATFISSTCSSTLVTSTSSTTPNSISNDFAFESTSPTQPDMQVYGYSNGIVPGFVCHAYYYLNNLSPFNGSGIFKATLPSAMMAGFVSATPSYTLSGDTILWNFTNVSYNSYTQFYVNFTVPVNTPLGSTFTTCMWANTTVTDLNPANNTSCYSRMVTGSFDPNDKSVSPTGTGPNGNIMVSETELTYLIRFQNTGNGPAVNIVVKDSISSNLDISTFQMLNASHAYAVDILPGNVLRWKFDNIMLIDSNANEPASHGYIQYRIKRNAINTIGTQIKNTAYIYFDFNDPVITNTTLNTLAAPTSIMDISKNESDWLVYPNPSNGTLYLINNTNAQEESQIQIVNAMGQTVYTETISSNRKTIDLSKLNNGVYFVKISSDTHNSVKRIVLSK